MLHLYACTRGSENGKKYGKRQSFGARETHMRGVLCAAILMCGLAVPALAQQKEPGAVTVGTVYAERKPIAKTLDFVGRVAAVNRVEIRARVNGYLEAVLFKEGDPVKEGDPLYRIEQGLFQAAVEQAQGALERSREVAASHFVMGAPRYVIPKP